MHVGVEYRRDGDIASRDFGEVSLHCPGVLTPALLIPALLRLGCICKSSDFIKMQIMTQQVWAGARDSAFLASSRMVLMLQAHWLAYHTSSEDSQGLVN